ncbi:MAG: GIY-YIG nuclease family protein [Armatimonadota bacterium]
MNDSGCYQLLIYLDSSKAIQIGKLGEFYFPQGYYVYTGSAMRGIVSRVSRHLSIINNSSKLADSYINEKNISKVLHWHIDFLLEHSYYIRYSSRVSRLKEECEINSLTLSMTGASVVVKKFGSSDCKCITHLVHFNECPDILPVEIGN